MSLVHMQIKKFKIAVNFKNIIYYLLFNSYNVKTL